MKTYQINQIGLNQIGSILAEYHKKGHRFTVSEIRAWADEVDFQLREGNSPSFEIQSWDHVAGRTQEFSLDDDGLDAVDVELEE